MPQQQAGRESLFFTFNLTEIILSIKFWTKRLNLPQPTHLGTYL